LAGACSQRSLSFLARNYGSYFYGKKEGKGEKMGKEKRMSEEKENKKQEWDEGKKKEG